MVLDGKQLDEEGGRGLDWEVWWDRRQFEISRSQAGPPAMKTETSGCLTVALPHRSGVA